jgi:PAS domain S-box-containing protein
MVGLMAKPDPIQTMSAPALAGLSLERMEALLAYSWDILSLLDGEGRLIYNSPAAQRLHGFEPSEMEGRSTFEFFHPEDAPKVAAVFQQCLAQPGLPFRAEYRYARKDGSWIWMEAVAVNLLDHPSIQAIVANSRDISGRVESLQALRAAEQFSDLILNTLTASLAVLDDQGCILKVNQSWRDFARLHGSSVELVWEGLGYLDICDLAKGPHSEEAPAMAAGIRSMLQGKLPEFTLEYPCPTPDGIRWYQARIMRFQGPGPARLVVSHIDITDLKLAEERRLQLERMLHHSQKMESLGSLAGGVAHDMNNVLGSILGLASMQQELQAPGSSAHQAFSIIAKSCHRGVGLARRLLDFARRDLTEPLEINLNTLIQEEVLMLERTTLGQVQFSTELAGDLRTIWGDPSALLHALMNLCLNAVDAMPGGGALALRTQNGEPGWVQVEVEDSGSGMTREVLEKALDPFFTTKPHGKGTGLGLSLVYSTVKAHRGSMELQSEPGKGTKVLLRFPAFESKGTRTPAPALACPDVNDRSLNILLVDDDAVLRNTLESMLRFLRHHVSVACTGEEALERLAAGDGAQVIILDVNMPGLGAKGTLPLLRKLCPGAPVLLVTGRVDQSVIELAQSQPGVSLLPKPFGLDELRRRLDALKTETP